MKTSVYLSNENLVVVTGKETRNGVYIDNFVSVPLYEGAVVNGKILNSEIIRSNLKRLRYKGLIPKRRVRLVFDRSTALVKFMRVPKLKEKNIIGIVKNNFLGASEVREELVYDYAFMRDDDAKDGTSLIMATGVEKSLITEYIEIFGGSGIELSNIDIALNAYLKFQSLCSEFRGRTFIISFVDADNIFSLLFIDGKYSFSNRFRLIAERGTPESVAEYAGFISSILQFNKAQNKGDIEQVLFCGLRESQKNLCDELTGLLGVNVGNLTSCSAISISDKLKSRKTDIFKNIFAVANLVE